MFSRTVLRSIASPSLSRSIPRSTGAVFSKIPQTSSIGARSIQISSVRLAGASHDAGIEWDQKNAYGEVKPNTKIEVEERILDIFRTFDKVKIENLSPTANFTTDLGLDSLDAVEVVMAIEEEFSIEISDADADEIRTVKDAIDYVLSVNTAL